MLIYLLCKGGRNGTGFPTWSVDAASHYVAGVLQVQSIGTRKRTLSLFHEELVSTAFPGFELSATGTAKMKCTRQCPLGLIEQQG